MEWTNRKGKRGPKQSPNQLLSKPTKSPRNNPQVCAYRMPQSHQNRTHSKHKETAILASYVDLMNRNENKLEVKMQKLQINREMSYEREIAKWPQRKIQIRYS